MSHPGPTLGLAAAALPLSTGAPAVLGSASEQGSGGIGMLRKIDHTRRMARFYCVEVMPDLFGDWTVRREWGRIGGASRSLSQTVATRDEAEAIAASRLQAKLRRGYVPVPGSSAGP